MRSSRVERELADVSAKYPGSQAVEEAAGSLVLVIPQFPIPAGFNLAAVRIAVRVPALYPTEKLDLFWLDPDLQRSGAGLPNVMGSGIQMVGQTWTQVSWHDNAPHDPNRITILGYIRGIRSWFARQVGVA